MPNAFEMALWVLLIVAAATDLLWGKIFNVITFPFLLAGLSFNFYLGGTPAILGAFLSIAIAFALFFPLYVFKILAAGDVKLLMAVAAWANTVFVIRLAALSILVGAFAGLVVLFKQKGFKMGGTTRMPFGPAFFCAAFLLKIFEMKGWKFL